MDYSTYAFLSSVMIMEGVYYHPRRFAWAVKPGAFDAKKLKNKLCHLDTEIPLNFAVFPIPYSNKLHLEVTYTGPMDNIDVHAVIFRTVRQILPEFEEVHL